MTPPTSALLLWLAYLTHTSARSYTCRRQCDVSKCPQLRYCTDTVVKDVCGCCDVCSTDAGHTTPPVRKDACDEVVCPRNKVCLLNLQDLPLCSCPKIHTCRKRRRPVCGTDGITYTSRCHMRVTACHNGAMVRLAHSGKCDVTEAKPQKPTKQSISSMRPYIRIKTIRRGLKNGDKNIVTSQSTRSETKLPTSNSEDKIPRDIDTSKPRDSDTTKPRDISTKRRGMTDKRRESRPTEKRREITDKRREITDKRREITDKRREIVEKRRKNRQQRKRRKRKKGRSKNRRRKYRSRSVSRRKSRKTRNIRRRRWLNL